MKNAICTFIGTAGTLIAGLFGGWDASLATLIAFMAIDFVTGLMVAGIFHNSQKTESGKIESKASFKGLCRKCMILLFVLIGARLDITIGASYIRDGICIAFIVNELISIIENAEHMGLPIPQVLMSAINTLKSKSENKSENKPENKEDK